MKGPNRTGSGFAIPLVYAFHELQPPLLLQILSSGQMKITSTPQPGAETGQLLGLLAAITQRRWDSGTQVSRCCFKRVVASNDIAGFVVVRLDLYRVI